MKSVKFKNGFEYLLVTNASKLCCIQVILHVGSKDDPKGKEGVAHFTEHMLFKNGIGSVLDKNGIEWNASTSRDNTIHTFICKEHDVLFVLQTVKKIMFTQKFFRNDLIKERKVIQEEIALRQSQRDRRLTNLAYSNMFTSKYRNDVKGSQQSVEKIGKSDIDDFYKKWYRPQNIKLVCIGNFDRTKLDIYLQAFRKKLKKSTKN